MTATNRSHNYFVWLFLGLALLAPDLSAELKFYDLKNPKQVLANPKIKQGQALAIMVTPRSQVWFNNQKVYVDPDGYALIGMHRDDNQADLKVTSIDGKTTRRQLDVIQRNYQIERIEGLPSAKVTAPPDPEIQTRIRKESQAIRKARRLMDDREDFLQGFIWPVKGRISGRYGSQRILNGKPKTPHYGVDVAVAKGTPVVAPADGKIIFAHPDMYYSGGTLVIDHGHGLSSAFLHLSKLHVQAGTWIKQGEIVAEVGATGRATGPHLDWRMNWGSKVRIDPQLLVAPMSSN